MLKVLGLVRGGWPLTASMLWFDNEVEMVLGSRLAALDERSAGIAVIVIVV